MYYVSISGVHGIGKTTICRLLARRNRWYYSPEIVDSLLPPPQFGPKSGEKLYSELWHMRQLIIRESELKRHKADVFVSDRWWQDLAIYSQVLLSPKEYRLVESLITAVPKEVPDLEIVLWAPDEAVLTRVRKRNRLAAEMWAEDDIDYLKKLNSRFKKYYEDFKDIRNVVLVECSENVEETYQRVKKVVLQSVVDEKQRKLGEYEK